MSCTHAAAEGWKQPEQRTFSISPHLSSYVLFSFSASDSFAVSSWICFSYSRNLSWGQRRGAHAGQRND